MAQATAYLKGYRQTPRKTRIVAKLVQGKRVEEALTLLDFAVKRPALPLRKLISSAISNARALGLAEDDLFIKEMRVDNGGMIKRFRPASRGAAHPVRRRSSHITIVLSTGAPKKKTKKLKLEEKS